MVLNYCKFKAFTAFRNEVSKEADAVTSSSSRQTSQLVMWPNIPKRFPYWTGNGQLIASEKSGRIKLQIEPACRNPPLLPVTKLYLFHVLYAIHTVLHYCPVKFEKLSNYNLASCLSCISKETRHFVENPSYLLRYIRNHI